MSFPLFPHPPDLAISHTAESSHGVSQIISLLKGKEACVRNIPTMRLEGTTSSGTYIKQKSCRPGTKVTRLTVFVKYPVRISVRSRSTLTDGLRGYPLHLHKNSRIKL
jgi:hypothetical protein